MKLNEYLRGVDIFALINDVQDQPFIDAGNSGILSAHLKDLYGERELFPKYENKTPQELAETIAVLYTQRWQYLVDQKALFENVHDRREVTENNNEKESRNNNYNETSKVSAYNSDELVNDEGKETSSDDSGNKDSERTLTETQINTQRAYDALSLAASKSIIESAVMDVANFSTLSIY